MTKTFTYIFLGITLFSFKVKGAALNANEEDFLMAALSGNAPRVAELLAAGISPDVAGGEGETALSMTIHAPFTPGHGDVIRALLNAGASRAVYALYGSPLHVAVEAKNLDAVTILRREFGFDPKESRTGPFRHMTALSEARGEIRAELDPMYRRMPAPSASFAPAGAGAAATDAADAERSTAVFVPEGGWACAYDGEPALMKAARLGNAPRVNQLLAEGVHPGTADWGIDSLGGSALTWAIRVPAASFTPEHEAIIRALLDANKDANRDSCFPVGSALHTAVEMNNVPAARILVTEYGFNPKEGMGGPFSNITAIDLAKSDAMKALLTGAGISN